MRQWFLFCCSDAHFTNLSAQFKSGERKLNQAGSQLERQKLKQVDSEIQFPPFGLVPWMHHVLIIQKCETVDEALFYVKRPSKGFSTTNLFYMKKWFLFYVTYGVFKKVQQAAGEFAFPSFFGLIPWMHYVLIITKCRSIEETLFYIKKTIADNLRRSALENCIRADLYHTAGAAVTNFAETLSKQTPLKITPHIA